MKIDRIGHAAFHCTDVQKSIAFYETVFGCRVKFALNYGYLIDYFAKQQGIDPEKTDDPRMQKLLLQREKVWLTYLECGDGFFFELFDSASSELAPNMAQFTGYQHMAIMVSDIQAAYHELSDKNVPIDAPPALGPDHTWQFWITDPDGNRFEFMQYTPLSMQIIGLSEN